MKNKNELNLEKTFDITFIAELLLQEDKFHFELDIYTVSVNTFV